MLRIPVVVNGGVENRRDALEAMKITGCDAVMSAGIAASIADKKICSYF